LGARRRRACRRDLSRPRPAPRPSARHRPGPADRPSRGRLGGDHRHPERSARVRGVLGVKIGVQLPEVEREVRWPELRTLALAAEETGFDSVWVGDHLLYRGDGRAERGPWDSWSVLAGIAAVTSRVEL